MAAIKRKKVWFVILTLLWVVVVYIVAKIKRTLDDDDVILFSSEDEMFSADKFDQLMALRRLRVERICKADELPAAWENKSFMLLEGQKFAWCPVYKAGSTNWQGRLSSIGELVKADFAELPGDVMTMVTVRHPFDRIVSAFRDKLERTHGRNTFYYDNYGVKMVSRHIFIAGAG